MKAALLRIFVCGFFALFASAPYANSADPQPAYPPATPFLHIETGMHAARINGVDVDAAERYLVTASYDKTARIWDLRTGKLLQVLRPPQGNGGEGQLWAIAISPDGATVAVGGYTGPSAGIQSVYLFDRASGALLRGISELPNGINHLAYSPNGRYLAAALHERYGIRVFRSPGYTLAAQDTDYGDTCYWAEFDRAGRLVTASYDGFIRLYDASLKLIAKKKAPGGKRPYSARFSPDGNKVAVGFSDNTSVNILSGSDLSFVSAPATPAGGGNLETVGWSRDGAILYAAGTYRGVSGLIEIATWQAATDKPVYLPASGNAIMDIRVLSQGRVAFGAFDPVVGVLDQKGRDLWRQTSEIFNYASPAGTVRLSRDGGVVQFGFFTFNAQQGWLRHVGRFELARRQISLEVSPDSSLSAPQTTGLAITGWEDTENPTLNGKTLRLEDYEMSRSLAVSPNADGFLLGSEWNIRLFDRSGSQKWQTPVPGVAWTVNLTADGRYAVAALGDGTIRWYRADSGQEVMGLFIHPDGRRWVLWTPEGFFDSSPNADALIGYHLNHGPDHAGEFVRVEQLRGLFYHPDLLAQRLKPNGADLVSAELARIGDVTAVLRSGAPPDLALLSSPESDSGGDYRLQFRVVDRGAGVGRVVYRIDGIEIEGRAAAPMGLDTVGRQFDLPPGRHVLSATAYDGSNRLESRAISAVVNVTQPDRQPSLYVVAVGISKYRDNALNQGVRFAASDAATVAARLKQQGTGLFQEVVTQVLTDAKASRANIEKTIAELAGKIRPADEFVLYLAGHGTAINGEYMFVPWNAVYSSGEALHDQSLNEERLQALLKSIPANKTLLLLDTCSAGAALAGRDPQISEKGSIERLSKLTGRVILAASSSEQMALEGYKDHGVFTYALLDGLASAVDSKGLIQVSTLADYIEEIVPNITRQRWGYEQFPMRLIQGQTFPIARKQ
jgi:WD40 repeat protein